MAFGDPTMGGGGAPVGGGGGGGFKWNDPSVIAAGINFIGNLLSGWAQGKISEKDLELRAQALGIQKEQLQFMKQQALRQNAIQEKNVGLVSPLLASMLGRAQQDVARRPDYTRLAPPRINNPYQPGGGRFGNPAPPVVGGIPGVSYGAATPPAPPAAPGPPQAVDPRLLAYQAAQQRLKAAG